MSKTGFKYYKIIPSKANLLIFLNFWLSNLEDFTNAYIHSVHWGINPPLKPPSLKSANCPSPPPLFRQFLPKYRFFVTPLKLKFSREPQKYYIFSSFTPSYLSKVTNQLKFSSLSQPIWSQPISIFTGKLKYQKPINVI